MLHWNKAESNGGILITVHRVGSGMLGFAPFEMSLNPLSVTLPCHLWPQTHSFCLLPLVTVLGLLFYCIFKNL